MKNLYKWEQEEEKARWGRKNKNKKQKKKEKRKEKRKTRELASASEWFAYSGVDNELPQEVIISQSKVEPLWVESTHRDDPERSFYVRPKSFNALCTIMEERDKLLMKNNRIRTLLEKNNFFKHIFCVGWRINSINIDDNTLYYAVRPDGKPNFRFFKLKKDGRVIYSHPYNMDIFMFVQDSGKRYFVCLTGKKYQAYKDSFVSYIEAKCSDTDVK